MDATALYRAGRLDEAIQALGVVLRDNPADAQRRTFLFELLCFAGKYDRAEKQLDILAQGGKDAQMGALLYRSALHAERTRQQMFEANELPSSSPAPRPVSGTLNGQPFQTIEDADPRVGARLEVFAAGQYTWIPFEQVASVNAEAPRQLRDLIWMPAKVRTAASFKGVELGEVILPVLTPLAWKHPEEAVRLGRVTAWQEIDGERQAPAGQRLLLVDGEEYPLLELRELRIDERGAAQ